MPHDTLITPAELKPHLGDDNWRIIDCRFSLATPAAGQQGYLAGHIPGALYAHLDHDLSAPITAGSGRHPLPTRTSLVEKFTAWGIDTQTQVVVYDTASGMMAARLWWLLRWMGHAAVAVLDGGLSRWQREDNALSSDVPVICPRHFIASAPLEKVISSEQLLAQLDSPDHRLIDVRSAERFLGQVEPLDRIAGHIPGAINVPLQQSLDAEGNFLSAAQLNTHFEKQLGVQPARHLSVMCGSGVTACHTLLAMHIAGIHPAQLYAGSWSEWITDPEHPVVAKKSPAQP